MDDDIANVRADSHKSEAWENMRDDQIPVSEPEILGASRRDKSVDFCPPFQLNLADRVVKQGDSGGVSMMACLVIRQHAISPKKPLSVASEVVARVFPEKRNRRRVVTRLDEAYSDWFQVTDHGAGKPKTIALTKAGAKALTVRGKQ